MSTSFAFEATGTHWRIDIGTPLSPDQERVLYGLIRDRIEQFERTYSRFRTDSLVARWRNVAGLYPLPPDAAALFALYQTAYEITGGLVTPLIGGVLGAAGYDHTYRFKREDKLRSPAPWESIMSLRPNEIELFEPAAFDFGAAGKGYIIDRVGDVCTTFGVAEYLIEAGGDYYRQSSGNSGEMIGLEHPDDESIAIGVATLRQGSLCGSAGNKRVWGEFHHIINPKTLESPRDTSALWVTAQTAAEADILTTVLMFVEADVCRPYFDFTHARLLPDGRLFADPDFPAEFFVTSNEGNDTM